MSQREDLDGELAAGPEAGKAAKNQGSEEVQHG
jgi:hypothetical protein